MRCLYTVTNLLYFSWSSVWELIMKMGDKCFRQRLTWNFCSNMEKNQPKSLKFWSKSMDTVIIGDENWVFQCDFETKWQSMEWKFPGLPCSGKALMSKSKLKTLLICFFDCKGIVHWVCPTWSDCQPNVISTLHVPLYSLPWWWRQKGALQNVGKLLPDCMVLQLRRQAIFKKCTNLLYCFCILTEVYANLTNCVPKQPKIGVRFFCAMFILYNFKRFSMYLSNIVAIQY